MEKRNSVPGVCGNQGNQGMDEDQDFEKKSPSENRAEPKVEAKWDAGNLGCGEILMQLRTRLEKIRPQNLFHLRTEDPGAIEDIPAWCYLTGHTLVKFEHPDYFIKKKNH